MANKHGYHSTPLTKAAALVQVGALGGIEISLTIAAIYVQTLDTQLGMSSQLVIAFAAIAILIGIFTFNKERRMARWGVIMLAVSIAGLLSTSYFGSTMNTGRELISFIGLGLIGTMVSGYFLLLYGSLKSAGWAFGGSILFTVLSAVAWVLIMILGNGQELRDDQMASRMVTGLILLSATAVGFIAFILEARKRRVAD